MTEQDKQDLVAQIRSIGGKKAIDTWREAHPGIQLDLSGTDLSCADLSGACLAKADLTETDMSWTDLCGADLREADLIEAIMFSAKLRGADLRGADMMRAMLRMANLREATLRRANLTRADLYGAQLTESDLREARLDRVDLDGANLRRVKISGTILEVGRFLPPLLNTWDNSCPDRRAQLLRALEARKALRSKCLKWTYRCPQGHLLSGKCTGDAFTTAWDTTYISQERLLKLLRWRRPKTFKEASV